MTQHITVVNYDPSWQLKYEHEKQKIRAILDSNLLVVYHIGSTAVANLAAKPIIDIMAVVRDLSLVDINKAAFEKIGYEYLGEFGIKGRRYLRKGGDERTHQIHIFKYDNLDEVIRHLAFRDYLRVQNDVCAEYAKLKKALAIKFPYYIDGYCDGKDGFVKEYEQKALAFYDSSWDWIFHAKGSGNPRFLHSQSALGIRSNLLLGSDSLSALICFWDLIAFKAAGPIWFTNQVPPPSSSSYSFTFLYFINGFLKDLILRFPKVMVRLFCTMRSIIASAMVLPPSIACQASCLL